MRKLALDALHSLAGPPTQTTSDMYLAQIANTFTRYAQTKTTVFDDGGGSTPSGPAAGNLLTRQAERALTTVLGRGVGKDVGGFMTALNSRFPIGGDGQVQFTPAQTAVALYAPAGDLATAQATAAGLAGQLSAEQATLYRHASTISADALRVLAGLQPFVPEAETDKVEALRALVQAVFSTVVSEFGRVDEPRPDRVERYLSALDEHLARFGETAFLDRRFVAPPSTDDEGMLAGYDLVRSYAATLRQIWNEYRRPRNRLTFPLFSQRLQRASVMLPVLAEGNANFMSAMDSVGYTTAERRSQAARFIELLPPGRRGGSAVPDITVGDLTDEVDSLATSDGPAYLADGGQYGLELLADQADRIFFNIAPVLIRVRAGATSAPTYQPIVAQVLMHERVSWALDDLFHQLDALADLAA
jgi:hypothetical protein